MLCKRWPALILCGLIMACSSDSEEEATESTTDDEVDTTLIDLNGSWSGSCTNEVVNTVLTIDLDFTLVDSDDGQDDTGRVTVQADSLEASTVNGTYVRLYSQEYENFFLSGDVDGVGWMIDGNSGSVYEDAWASDVLVSGHVLDLLIDGLPPAVVDALGIDADEDAVITMRCDLAR